MSEENDQSGRRDGLSEAKRRLLDQRLRARGGLRERPRSAAAESTAKTLRRRPEGEPTPLSFAQTRLWFLEQLGEMGPAYNIAGALTLRGHLEVAVFEQALREVVRRHEVLRTTFRDRGGVPEQEVADEFQAPLQLEDLSSLEPEERRAGVERLTQELADRHFDTARGPLFHLLLVRTEPEVHRLAWCFHHAICDIWSIGVFSRDLSALYNAFRAGRPSPLPELRIQYGDYSRWQRERLQGDLLDRRLGYWRGRLGDAPPVLELPTDRPRPAVQSYSGSTCRSRLPAELISGISALAQKERATPFMVMMAALQVLLQRYSRQDDFVVGSPIAGRDRSEVQDLIGLFVGMMPMRADLAGDPPFRDLVARVRQTAVEAYANAEIPFEMLVDKLKLPRDLSHHPVFQVLFGLQTVAGGDNRFHGLESAPVEVEKDGAILDLSLYAWPEGEEMGLTLEYNRDLFDEETASRLLRHYRQLLGSVVKTPDLPISRLDLLPAEERREVLLEWNDTVAPWEPGTIHGLFAEQAARTPEAIAVEGGGERWTYRELADRSSALARWLRAEGVGPETLVGVFMDRSPRLLVALLGVLQAGGAYLPLDPSFPSARLAYMVEHSGSPLILTESLLADQVPAGPRAVAIDTAWDAMASVGGDEPPAVHPAQLAYVIYTSGSTGRPKGVAIEHRSAANFLRAMALSPGLEPSDRLLAVTTLSFDISVLELFLPLTVGARTMIATKAVAADGERLLAAIHDSGATVMQATPASWQMLLDSGQEASPLPRVLCGGEALPRELAGRLLERTESLVNLYGPTEATVWATLETVTSTDRTVPIGKPIRNLRVFVLDGALQPVAVGVPGDLYVGGVGVARGYLNRPDLTADRFVPDPFAGREAPGRGGDRLYRTGDQARWLADGRLEFLGRDDHQVKVRGFRIELGEIEAALSRHPAVGQVVVIVREDQPGDKRLVAYVVPAAEKAPGVAEMREFLRDQLPEYMVPSACVELSSIPQTPNGKIDRRALPEPDPARPDSARTHVEPRTPEEVELAAIWSEVLRVERVGATDNFFELGGHSLLATRLVARIASEMGVDLALRGIFERPRLAQLAELVQMKRWDAGRSASGDREDREVLEL